MGKIVYFIFIVLCIGLGSCSNKKSEQPYDIEMHQQTMSETYVDTVILRTSSFDKQIVCNGRLRAKAKSELNFVTQGVTTSIFVKEGMRVSKGALIAALDKRERVREVEKAEKELERTKVELVDKLISLGYDATMKGVPEEMMKRAEVTSGYFTAKFQLQSARKALDECNLYAPFCGRIANLEARPYQRNDKICTLIDDSQFEVEFRILEAELSSVKKGQKIKVSPFISDSLIFEGIVTEINPLVDDKGLIKIMARLDNKDNILIDGMNVRIIIEEQVRNMFVVPKDAVVERDGYHVIFIYKDGQAVWTYVDVVHSNISSFAITGCQRKETSIHEGDIVITSGNLNLADGTEVKIN
ncbi:MAG: efflux RND transporter periplasmic adaptor subunit [Prevotella ruminicola]|jgi:RND family efflux transporter MFP subunit|uniref:Efflux RND transporter periplasmic adaptor subunit n=1 Tax=Xylanibacter ruminicola TaxID=839 RepID=A0A928BRE3_XYLRU|nr:efflux RND transporter periplasmic adaptor subunit [Xylanibacter ruminicola]